MRRFFVLASVAFVLMLATFLLCSSEARAQEQQPVRYGLTMGLNMGKWAWNEAFYDNKDGRLPVPTMRFGWVAEFFTASPAISIVTGVDYRMTREKYWVIDPGVWTGRMGTYLTVPVLFKCSPKRIKGMWPFFELGPQAAFILSFAAKDDPPGRAPENGASMEMTDFVRRVTPELRGGAGIEFPMGKMLTGVIQAGYEYGLTSILNETSWMQGTARNLFFTMGARF